MNIGPLEYVVIGVQDRQFDHALCTELKAIQEAGQIGVVDLLFVTKAADGTVVTQEVDELNEQARAPYGALTDNLMDLLTTQDVEYLTSQVALDTTALIILFEHAWVAGLLEAMRKHEGVVFNAGMVTHEALAQVNAERTEKEAQNA